MEDGEEKKDEEAEVEKDGVAEAEVELLDPEAIC